MEHPFNDLEGLRIAMLMEKRGADFYRHAARITRNERALALLNRLAADETSHQKDFQAEYEAQLLRDGEAFPPYDLEGAAYLSAVAADVVFPGGLFSLAKDGGLDSPRAILESAMRAEKDSILFYLEIADRTSDEAARAIFRRIASQEKGHLSELQLLWMEEWA